MTNFGSKRIEFSFLRIRINCFIVPADILLQWPNGTLIIEESFLIICSPKTDTLVIKMIDLSDK